MVVVAAVMVFGRCTSRSTVMIRVAPLSGRTLYMPQNSATYVREGIPFFVPGLISNLPAHEELHEYTFCFYTVTDLEQIVYTQPSSTVRLSRHGRKHRH